MNYNGRENTGSTFVKLFCTIFWKAPELQTNPICVHLKRLLNPISKECNHNKKNKKTKRRPPKLRFQNPMKKNGNFEKSLFVQISCKT